MRKRTALFSLLAGLALVGAAAVVHAQAREEGRLLVASEILKDMRGARDQSIPDRLLERAYGILVIPDTTKIAWFFGGRRGHGVMVVRDKDGKFSSPVFVTMTGGSFGFQWGVQSTDIVLVFTTPRGVQGINGGKITLGGDVSVAAGPVGRDAFAATDAMFKAEVFSYSRSRGAFVGLALDGTVISIDDKADAHFYHKPGVLAGDIMSGSVRSEDESSRRFLGAVSSSTTESRRQASAASAPHHPAAPARKPAPAAGSAQSFPLADSKPGSEPK
ncbi:MAG TPA: lipid-binding SYLF domain-containing protein [Steroidobacteraceae bacterium]|nr:lipid-binding SYLF domain-containing protein [Steroidobacteraceae bacterium]